MSLFIFGMALYVSEQCRASCTVYIRDSCLFHKTHALEDGAMTGVELWVPTLDVDHKEVSWFSLVRSNRKAPSVKTMSWVLLVAKMTGVNYGGDRHNRYRLSEGSR